MQLLLCWGGSGGGGGGRGAEGPVPSLSPTPKIETCGKAVFIWRVRHKNHTSQQIYAFLSSVTGNYNYLLLKDVFCIK